MIINKRGKMKTYKCVKCGHEWIPRSDKKPESCPKCKNRKWQEEKVGK